MEGFSGDGQDLAACLDIFLELNVQGLFDILQCICQVLVSFDQEFSQVGRVLRFGQRLKQCRCFPLLAIGQAALI